MRKVAHENAKQVVRALIKNGKFFVQPQKTEENFKQLFARLAAVGAGRLVDREGFPDGPWTPETLADEISSFDANRNGIELRAVQVWFQDNDNGISNDNIRWLARIFGCGDPEAAALWQAELTLSKDRLASERRARRQTGGSGTSLGENLSETLSGVDRRDEAARLPTEPIEFGTGRKNAGFNLPLQAEAMFSGPNALNLPIAVWGGLGVLWIVTFSLGVHSVTYSPQSGIEKQVGFIWSPGWNIGDMVFLPTLLIVVSGRLNAWKKNERV